MPCIILGTAGQRGLQGKRGRVWSLRLWVGDYQSYVIYIYILYTLWFIISSLTHYGWGFVILPILVILIVILSVLLLIIVIILLLLSSFLLLLLTYTHTIVILLSLILFVFRPGM